MKPAESFSVLSSQRHQDVFLRSFWVYRFHSHMLLQTTLSLSLVVSSLKSVCGDFSIFSAVMPQSPALCLTWYGSVQHCFLIVYQDGQLTFSHNCTHGHIFLSLSSWHTHLEHSHFECQVFSEGCLFPRVGRTNVQWSQIQSSGSQRHMGIRHSHLSWPPFSHFFCFPSISQSCSHSSSLLSPPHVLPGMRWVSMVWHPASIAAALLCFGVLVFVVKIARRLVLLAVWVMCILLLVE